MKLALFTSGNGSGVRAIAAAISEGELIATISLVVSNRASCRAVEWAKAQGIETMITDPGHVSSDQVCLDAMTEREIDIVILAGYLKKVGAQVLEHYRKKVLNVHPSLLPKFGGSGMHGNRVHKAVLDAGETTTGASIHIVDAEYDTGPIIAQAELEVHSDDTPDSLAARVKQLEGRLLVESLRDLGARDLAVHVLR